MCVCECVFQFWVCVNLESPQSNRFILWTPAKNSMCVFVYVPLLPPAFQKPSSPEQAARNFRSIMPWKRLNEQARCEPSHLNGFLRLSLFAERHNVGDQTGTPNQLPVSSQCILAAFARVTKNTLRGEDEQGCAFTWNASLPHTLAPKNDRAGKRHINAGFFLSDG